MDKFLDVKGQNSTHSYAVYTRNVALHFEVVWSDFHRCNWRFQKGVGWVRGPGNLHSVKSLVWWLIWRGLGLGVLEYPVEWVAMKILSII